MRVIRSRLLFTESNFEQKSKEQKSKEGKRERAKERITNPAYLTGSKWDTAAYLTGSKCCMAAYLTISKQGMAVLIPLPVCKRCELPKPTYSTAVTRRLHCTPAGSEQSPKKLKNLIQSFGYKFCFAASEKSSRKGFI